MSGLPGPVLERPAQGTAQGLVVLLHGVGSNEQSLAGFAATLDPRLHVLLPRAPLVFGPQAFGWFSVRFGAQGPVIDPAQAEAARLQVRDWLAAQQARLGVGPARTVLAGFSQGGIISASVALTAPAQVKSFAVLCGRILPEITPHIPADIGTQGLQGLLVHGRQDEKLPFALAEAAAGRLRALGVAHELRAYPAPHTLSAAMQDDTRRWISARLLSLR
ncbi:phospholipase [Stenotrophomonas sp. 24(2023)]|uniref:alpha/beta hydrolase n=1 Tax=Stenotrophomonas sp. 24(2023) TaxID=3068324 RepID=UPI0027E127C4|nr:phospholipase [Stenotrophomonas sp. 24(2023)]WMJ67675.1 phospholipase [Stenotrophomonas sp. 24(2023)]